MKLKPATLDGCENSVYFTYNKRLAAFKRSDFIEIISKFTGQLTVYFEVFKLTAGLTFPNKSISFRYFFISFDFLLLINLT